MWKPSAGVERVRQGASCRGWVGMMSELLSLDAPGLTYLHATMS